MPQDVEQKGSGINSLSYWVTSSLSEEWVELPLVTPEQLRLSRQIKYVFKGDLLSKIIGNPNFPGTEAHLLKCQIVRISFSSSISHKGLFTVNPENDREINPYEVQPD